MTTLVNEIDNVKFEFKKVLENLDEINQENFEVRMKSVNDSIAKLDERREEVRKLYPQEELKKYNGELDLLIKEIVNKFDSIISENKSEQKKLGTELRNMLNKKKLANYR